MYVTIVSDFLNAEFSFYMQPSFLWYDFETTGAKPHIDKPIQFAAIRTDASLNIISAPTTLYCKLPLDYVPELGATLVTGITPQEANAKGIPEPAFCKTIVGLMSTPQTCNVGYNSIRFDDEVCRHMFFRNFHDPYAREWQNDCSRWDIIDLVRACYVIKPDILNWPYHENGAPSFKLEDLSKANHLAHEQAHDALSDVYATIGLAKLIKERAPQLFDYVFNLRKKVFAQQQIKLESGKPLLHISSKIAALKGCATIIVPIATHPINKNAVICVNLTADPRQLEQMTVAEIVADLYASQDTLLEQNKVRPGLKLIHVNKTPFIAPVNTLTDEIAQRLSLDMPAMRQHYDALKQMELTQKLVEVFEQESSLAASSFYDEQLYSGGFISNIDRKLCQHVIHKPFDALQAYEHHFTETRLNEVFFLYKARHHSEHLTEGELIKWKAHIAQKLFTKHADRPTLSEMIEACDVKLTEDISADTRNLVKKFYDYLINFNSTMEDFIELSSFDA